MSRLYFTTEDDEVEIKGWEYHWIKGLADDVTQGFLNLEYDADEWLPLINPAHYMGGTRPGNDRATWAQAFRTALRADGSGGTHLLQWKGHRINGHHLTLNTGIKIGGDAVKLGTRFGAQAELHAWIDGPNRAWVADMIEHAVKSGVYRDGLRRTGAPDLINDRHDPDRFSLEPSGWSDVVRFLRSDDSKPVVIWYSVMDGFPDNRMIDMDYEEWEDLPDGEQWSRCMDSLRSGEWSQRYKGLEIKPDDWNDFRYGHTLTVLDLHRPDRDQLLDRVLAKGWLK